MRFEGHIVRLRDQKGLQYLSRLLADPGREFHVLDLVLGNMREPRQANQAPEPNLGPRGGLGAFQLIDAEARESYRRRLTEIEEDIDDARASGDFGRLAQAEGEREFLVRELSRAFGLNGRVRPGGSDSERARVSVTRAVRQAMARIREHNLPLGEHLDQAIRTGTYCSYRPDPRVPVNWEP